MKNIKLILLWAIFLIQWGLLTLSVGDELFDPLEKYPSFSFNLQHKVNFQRAAETGFRVNLPADPKNKDFGHLEGRLNLEIKGSGVHAETLDRKQAKELMTVLTAAVKGYVLPASDNKPVEESISLSVHAGNDHATFVFIKKDAAQWKRVSQAWNSIRAMLNKAQADKVPLLN
jgi:hypothetical protein